MIADRIVFLAIVLAVLGLLAARPLRTWRRREASSRGPGAGVMKEAARDMARKRRGRGDPRAIAVVFLLAWVGCAGAFTSVRFHGDGRVLYCTGDDRDGRHTLDVDYYPSAQRAHLAFGELTHAMAPSPDVCRLYDEAVWNMTREERQDLLRGNEPWRRCQLHLRKGPAVLSVSGTDSWEGAEARARELATRTVLAEYRLFVPKGAESSAGVVAGTPPSNDPFSLRVGRPYEMRLRYDSSRPVRLVFQYSLCTLTLGTGGFSVAPLAGAPEADVVVETNAGRFLWPLDSRGRAEGVIAALARCPKILFKAQPRHQDGFFVTVPGVIHSNDVRAPWGPPPLAHPPGKTEAETISRILDYCTRFYSPDADRLFQELDDRGRPAGANVESCFYPLSSLIALAGRQCEMEFWTLWREYEPRGWMGSDHDTMLDRQDLEWTVCDAWNLLHACAKTSRPGGPGRERVSWFTGSRVDSDERAAAWDLVNRTSKSREPRVIEGAKGPSHYYVQRRASSSPIPHAIAALALADAFDLFGEEPFRAAAIEQARLLVQDHLAAGGGLRAWVEPGTPGPLGLWPDRAAYPAWTLSVWALRRGHRLSGDEKLGRAALALRAALFALWDRRSGGFPPLRDDGSGTWVAGPRRSLADQLWAALAARDLPLW